MSKLMTNGQYYSVTLKDLSKMGPCDTYTKDNFKYAIELFNGRDRLTLDDILKLDISTEDKIWISNKIVPYRELAKLQIMWAYWVLPVFEREYPDDYRPRRAIQALETWIEDPSCENNMWLIAARQNMIHDLAYITTGAAWSASVIRNVSVWDAARDAASALEKDAELRQHTCTGRLLARKIAREDAWLRMLSDLLMFAKAECIS